MGKRGGAGRLAPVGMISLIKGVVQQLRRPLTLQKQVRILVIAGGGIRSLLAARFTGIVGVGKQVQDAFHLFVAPHRFPDWLVVISALEFGGWHSCSV